MSAVMTRRWRNVNLRLRNRYREFMHRLNRYRFLVGAGALLMLASVAGCTIDSTNTYPIDFFSGMHYQKSFKTLEPPRLLGPEGAVPVQGRAPMYDQQELTEMENPLEATGDVIARGQRIYEVNCQFCHGTQAMGDGPVAGYFQNAEDARPPADLTQERLVNIQDGYIYSVVQNGLGQWMPAFGNLIPGEDIWALVHYIRVLQEDAGGQ